ncbi:unnamed protein product [Caenorhabditis brenneri]
MEELLAIDPVTDPAVNEVEMEDGRALVAVSSRWRPRKEDLISTEALTTVSNALKSSLEEEISEIQINADATVDKPMDTSSENKSSSISGELIKTCVLTGPPVKDIPFPLNADIAKLFANLGDHHNLRTLRVISSTNHGVVDDKQKTFFDFPSLWPQVFRRHAADIDNSMAHDEVIDELSTSVLAHLKNNHELQDIQFASGVMRKLLAGPTNPSKSLWEAFLNLYRPKVILWASASLTEVFSHPHPLAAFRNFVATIQIDEANQFPMHSLLIIFSFIPTGLGTVLY